MAETAFRVRVSGRVQGVAFRAWTKGRAGALGLRGWVRNRGDGSVEALLAGEKDAVEAMLTAFWEGPGAAEVSGVIAEVVSLETVPGGFEIGRDG